MMATVSAMETQKKPRSPRCLKGAPGPPPHISRSPPVLLQTWAGGPKLLKPRDRTRCPASRGFRAVPLVCDAYEELISTGAAGPRTAIAYQYRGTVEPDGNGGS